MRRALVLVLVTGCGNGPPASSSPDAAGTSDGPDTSMVTCTGSQAGAYCGGDQVDGGDTSTLYECPGSGMQPASAMHCDNGCVVEAPGTPDHCMVPVSADSFRLPWGPGVTMQLTQDCNDACCSDHVGNDEYAYDWANGGSFDVLATRGGTITHLKINSTTGCGSTSCTNDANYIVIDHGDGTESTYLHLEGNTLASGITCGGTVTRGQLLARSGTTGWSTGIHLHYQVSKVHAGVATCECGSDGQGCSPSTVTWSSFWVTPTYPSVPIGFDEWPGAAQCANRRITMPASQNQ